MTEQPETPELIPPDLIEVQHDITKELFNFLADPDRHDVKVVRIHRSFADTAQAKALLAMLDERGIPVEIE